MRKICLLLSAKKMARHKYSELEGPAYASYSDYHGLLLNALGRNDISVISRIADVLGERGGQVGPWSEQDRKLGKHKTWVIEVLEYGQAASIDCLRALWHESYGSVLTIRTAFALASLRFPLGLCSMQTRPFCFTRDSVRVPSLLRRAIETAKFEHLLQLQLPPWNATRTDFLASFPVPYPGGSMLPICPQGEGAGLAKDVAAEQVVGELIDKFAWRPGSSELAAFCLRAITSGHACVLRRLLSAYQAKASPPSLWPGLTLALAAGTERFDRRIEQCLEAGNAASYACATALCISMAGPVRFQACSVVVRAALTCGSADALTEIGSVLLEPQYRELTADFAAAWPAWFHELCMGRHQFGEAVHGRVALDTSGTASAMDLAVALAAAPFGIGQGTALYWVGLIGRAKTLDRPCKIGKLARPPWSLDMGDLWRAMLVGCEEDKFSPAGVQTLLAAFGESMFDYIVDADTEEAEPMLVRAMLLALVRLRASGAVKQLGASPRWREAVRPMIRDAVVKVLEEAKDHASFMRAVPLLEVLTGAPW